MKTRFSLLECEVVTHNAVNLIPCDEVDEHLNDNSCFLTGYSV